MRLKWKGVRTSMLIATVALGMSSAFIYATILRSMSSGAHLPIRDPDSFLPIEGQEVSFDQAQASVPFKISLPKNMGNPVQIKLLKPPQAYPERVIIIYAANKPSSDTTTFDVLDQNGIILYETTNLMTLKDSILNIKAAIDSTDDPGDLQEVNINGYVGCAGGNIAHVISWYTETTFYELAANLEYPLQQLLEIARSIPVT